MLLADWIYKPPALLDQRDRNTFHHYNKTGLASPSWPHCLADETNPPDILSDSLFSSEGHLVALLLPIYIINDSRRRYIELKHGCG